MYRVTHHVCQNLSLTLIWKLRFSIRLKLKRNVQINIKRDVSPCIIPNFRYASLVDPLLPQITACLRDSSLVVRRTTLVTLIHLLQEDYLKMTGMSGRYVKCTTLCHNFT